MQRFFSTQHIKPLVLGLMLATAAPSAMAGAFITSGSVALGVNDEGQLNFVDPDPAKQSANGAGGAVGVSYLFPDNLYRDATSPGCLCEGWGVSANGTNSGSANQDDGVVNLTVDIFTSTASTATSTVHLTDLETLSVTQAYQPSTNAPSNLFRNQVTIKNSGTLDLTDVKYVRVMDWDVPPTEFNEFVTIKGTASTTLLELSHDNGFSVADPLGGDPELVAGTTDVDFTDSGPTDHGAYFRFNLGTIKAGENFQFDIFYGAAENERAAIAAIALESIELYSLGQSSDPAGGPANDGVTYIFGFKGVGGRPIENVPAPASIALMGLGLAGLAVRRRRQNR